MRSSDRPYAVRLLGGALALVFAGLLWSVLASTVFLAGTRLLTPVTLPFQQFWAYEHYYGFGHPVVGTWLKVAALVPTVLIVALVVVRLARGGSPAKTRDLHGETRWARPDEMRRAGLYTDFGGLFVGKDARGRHLRFGGPEHVACYAPTRSGKGVGLVIPNCLLYEASLVCLDVKKENWTATAGIRARAGQQVHLFDPLAADGRTARYNPFSYVRRGTLDAFEDIQRIAQMIFPHVAGDQAFWTDSARSAFTGTAAFVAETPELPFTMGEVLRLLSGNDGATRMLHAIEARRQARRPYTEATVRALEDYLLGSADLVNSIRKTVTARLSLWFNPRIDAATAESDFDFRRLRHGLHAIYIGVTPDNIARLRPLLALFFQQLVDVLVRQLPQHDPQARHQVLLLLDEFPLLGPMPVLADAFAHIAGYNVRLMLVMQSKAQLRDRELYGPDGAAAILDNCGLEVVFGTKDLKLTEELSARLGYATVEGTSRSGPLFWRLFNPGKLNMTQSDQRRALLLPQEVARLDPSEAILVRPGYYPVRCRRIRYFEDARFRPLVGPPPVIAPIEIDVRLDKGSGAVGQGSASRKPDDSPEPSEIVEKATGSVSSRARAGKSVKAETSGASALETASGTAGSGRTAPRRALGPLTPASAIEAPIAAQVSEADASVLQPHQADGLLGAIAGMDVDLSGLGLEDGKAFLSTIVDLVPTVDALNARRKVRA